ncbi:MAG: hypothetical protein GF353_15135 [Candidatus Lokiarchaeota archaeon]|nr:hypothetical protein [Candidatus Lokiarchaeota archaeon]
MALFSQRKEIKPISKALQLEEMDAELRNSLWSAIHISYWEKWRPYEKYGIGWSRESQNINNLLRKYWLSYFKLPVDNLPRFESAVSKVREYFFSCEWNEVYDLIEFTAKFVSPFTKSFIELCNVFLEKENSGYRFVNNEITPITDVHEIEAIETASNSKLSGINLHLNTALSLLSDRKNPDYRNSIKESISAVENICRTLSGNQKATLGSALKLLNDRTSIHPALEKAFSSLYGYTSDEGGIRHSILEENNISFSDAKFMLVACSGFINYLLGKVSELKIET